MKHWALYLFDKLLKYVTRKLITQQKKKKKKKTQFISCTLFSLGLSSLCSALSLLYDSRPAFPCPFIGKECIIFIYFIIIIYLCTLKCVMVKLPYLTITRNQIAWFLFIFHFFIFYSFSFFHFFIFLYLVNNASKLLQ